MDAIERANLQSLRERIERSLYRVDPEVVAAAILARLAGRGRPPGGAALGDRARTRPAPPGV